MWQHVVFAIFIGGLVGAVGHLKKHGKLIMPKRTKQFIYLGFLEEMVLGSLASALLVLSSDASSLLKVAFLSILAGLGGEALIRSLDLLRAEKK
jgi:hypothetical protein